MTRFLYAVALALVGVYAALIHGDQSQAGDVAPAYTLLVLGLWASIRDREDVR